MRVSISVTSFTWSADPADLADYLTAVAVAADEDCSARWRHVWPGSEHDRSRHAVLAGEPGSGGGRSRSGYPRRECAWPG